MSEAFLNLLIEFYQFSGEPYGKPFEELTNEELDELVDEAFDWYKKNPEFKCYETVRAKIRNYLSPITNSVALIEHSIRTRHSLTQKEIEFIKESLDLSITKLMSI